MLKSKTIYKLKQNRIIRVVAWPILKTHELWKRIVYRCTKDSKYILSLKNKYEGERCFIIGNGPSLSVRDLEKLQGEFSFASNRIYNVFNDTKWRPTFYVAIDPYIIQEDIEIMQNLELDNMLIGDAANKYMIFKKKKWHSLLRVSCNLKKLSEKNVFFSKNPERCIGTAYSVTGNAMELAAHMGFTKIYLLGVDHSYPVMVKSDGTSVNTGQSESHFYRDSNAHVASELFVDGVNRFYQLAKDHADKNGIKIYNATRGGKLEIFERVDFDTLFLD